MRKLIKITFAAAFVAIAGYGVYTSQKVEPLSELVLANVEALAEEENNECNYTNGYTAFTNKGGGAYDCCKVWVPKAPDTDEGHCR